MRTRRVDRCAVAEQLGADSEAEIIRTLSDHPHPEALSTTKDA